MARALQEDHGTGVRRRVGVQPDAAGGRRGRSCRLEGRRGQGGRRQVRRPRRDLPGGPRLDVQAEPGEGTRFPCPKARE